TARKRGKQDPYRPVRRGRANRGKENRGPPWRHHPARSLFHTQRQVQRTADKGGGFRAACARNHYLGRQRNPDRLYNSDFTSVNAIMSHLLMRNLIGQPAVPFTLPDAGQKSHSLDDYRGSWLLLVFHRHLG